MATGKLSPEISSVMRLITIPPAAPMMINITGTIYFCKVDFFISFNSLKSIPRTGGEEKIMRI